MQTKDSLLRRVVKSRAFNVVIIAVVVSIPLLYAGLLTWTYQKPFELVDQMQAAIVNLDQPVQQTGLTGDKPREFNIGKKIVDELTTGEGEKGFTWRATSPDDAQAGLASGRYHAVLEIPKDLSASVSALDSANAAEAAAKKLQLTTDDGVSYLAGTMARTIGDELQSRVRETANQEITEALVGAFGEVHGSLHKAADGAGKLAKGNSALVAGAGELSTGIGKLQDGSRALAQGTGKLAAGAQRLEHGAASAATGAGKLAHGAASAAAGAQGVANGAKAADQGAQKLAAGSARVNDGAQQLSGGATELAQGTKRLGEGAAQLSGGAKTLDEKTGELEAGIGELKAGLDKLSAALPNQNDPQQQAQIQRLIDGGQAIQDAMAKFAQAVSHPAGAAGQSDAGGLVQATSALSQGAEQVRGGVHELIRNAKQVQQLAPLAAKGPELEGAASKTLEYVQQVKQTCQAIPLTKLALDQDLRTICGGLKGLQTGTTSYPQILGDDLQLLGKALKQLPAPEPGAEAKLDQLGQGVDALAAGASQLKAGAVQMQQAISGAGERNPGMQQGLKQYVDGVNALIGKLGELKKLAPAVAQLDAGAGKLAQGAGQLREQGSKKLYTASVQLTDGAGKLVNGAEALSHGAGELTQGTSAVASGSQQLAQGTAKLSAGSGQLASGTQQLKDGSSQLAAGTAQLKNGSAKLAQGAASAAGGANQLAAGAGKAHAGAGKLTDGAKKAQTGAQELSDKLGEGAAKVPNYTGKTKEDVAHVAAAPISVDAVRLHPVQSNGAGFTPFFMSLALWIGGIAAFFIFPAIDRRRAGDPWWAGAVRSSVLATMVGIGQAVLVALVVGRLVGVSWSAMPALVGMLALTSLAFVAINQALVALLGFRGRFFSVLLLVLQISAMGATFPIQTAPRFIQAISPFLPMTHTAAAFRTIIAGAGLSIWPAIGMLVVTLVGSMIVTGASAWAVRNQATPDDDPTVPYTPSSAKRGFWKKILPDSIMN